MDYLIQFYKTKKPQTFLQQMQYSSCRTWWHTGRNQILSFPETDESI